MVPVLAAAQRRGDDVVVIGPPSMGEMISRAGFTFLPGGEPEESVIAPIRELLPVVSREEATVLGNRELFGRLATTAMFPAMERTISTLRPDLVVRDPMEYASAVVAGRLAIPTAQIAISLADGEAASIAAASPALEEHRPGLTAELMASPYLTRFPASLDPRCSTTPSDTATTSRSTRTMPGHRRTGGTVRQGAACTSPSGRCSGA